MMEFVQQLAKAVSRRNGGNDDSIDRMHWKLTSLMLVMFSLIVTATQFVGEPIECWCPAEFTDNYLGWANKLCWVKNTYYVSIDNPVKPEHASDKQLVYYQWTPFILLFQALCFFIPQLIWKTVINQSGFSIKNLTHAGEVYAMASKVNEREQTVSYISRQLDYYLAMRNKRTQSRIEEKIKIFCNKRKGNFLVFFYMLTKLFYLANCIFQFFLLSVLLGTDFLSFGKSVVENIVNGVDLPDSPYFPRVTLCDFKVRAYPHHIRPYTVECVLSINLFNEKIFIFLWFWLCIVAILTALNFLTWTFRMAIPNLRIMYIRRYIKTFRNLRTPSSKIDRFVNKYLRDDGVFMIRMLSTNASDLVAGEVVGSLWDNFTEAPRDKEEDDLPM